jgi:hypothetical protein
VAFEYDFIDDEYDPIAGILPVRSPDPKQRALNSSFRYFPVPETNISHILTFHKHH